MGRTSLFNGIIIQTFKHFDEDRWCNIHYVRHVQVSGNGSQTRYMFRLNRKANRQGWKSSYCVLRKVPEKSNMRKNLERMIVEGLDFLTDL